MKLNWFEKIKNIGMYASPILFLVSGAADVIDVTNTFAKILKPVMYASSGIVLIYALYFMSERRKYFELLKKSDENIKTISVLENEICDGMKFTRNHVQIIFDIEKKKYLFEFCKDYTILTDSIKWFPAQFYCNKILDDAVASSQYYTENPVPWDKLNIKASLSYKNIEDNEFSKNYDLSILQIAEGINYKQFHIQYKTLEGDSLNINKGAEIKLCYSYEVPVTLWGSFLNRTISYFAEKSSVIIACNLNSPKF